MNDVDLSHIEGIVWDLDGTLYRYDQLFVKACNIAAARTAIDLGLEMSFDDAFALATESERTYGNSFHFFGDHGVNYRDYHVPYHDAVDITVLKKTEAMKEELQKLGLPMTILTNASRGWARRTLNHIELYDLFGEDNIIALEDNDYRAKASHTGGFEIGLSRLNLPAKSVAMVDDLSRNLPKAKEAGLTTVFLHHGRIPDQHPASVDVMFADALQFVRQLRADRRLTL